MLLEVFSNFILVISNIIIIIIAVHNTRWAEEDKEKFKKERQLSWKTDNKSWLYIADHEDYLYKIFYKDDLKTYKLRIEEKDNSNNTTDHYNDNILILYEIADYDAFQLKHE